jgi:hypothetical protein
MKFLRVLSIIGLVTTASPAWASLVSPQSPLSLEQQADLVVVGNSGATALVGGASLSR